MTTSASARFVHRHPAHWIAFCGGVGLAPVAPGTFGTLLAFPVYLAIAPFLDPIEYGLLIVALFGIGIWACGEAGRALGVHDHGGMVWDELVAMLTVLFFVPEGWAWQVAAFLLFRLFDITKPPPIRYYERIFPGGFGVMIDDIAAAFYTLVVLAVAKTITG